MLILAAIQGKLLPRSATTSAVILTAEHSELLLTELRDVELRTSILKLPQEMVAPQLVHMDKWFRSQKETPIG